MDALTSERIGESDASLVVRILVMAHRIDVVLTSILAHEGLTVPRALALFMLRHHEHVMLGGANLARLLGLSAAAMGELLHALEEEELITFEHDPKDGRLRVIRLTDAGREAAAIAEATLESRANTVLWRIAPHDRPRLRWELDAIDHQTQERDGQRLPGFRRRRILTTPRYC
jgi:DNA-binding MarR family transcriptional regulator